MSQVSRYGHMLKLRVDGVRMRVLAHYRTDGSVINDDVQARLVGVESRLELESPESADVIRRLVRTAEEGCYVLQALKQPVEVTSMTVLNGNPLAP